MQISNDHHGLSPLNCVKDLESSSRWRKEKWDESSHPWCWNKYRSSSYCSSAFSGRKADSFSTSVSKGKWDHTNVIGVIYGSILWTLLLWKRRSFHPFLTTDTAIWDYGFRDQCNMMCFQLENTGPKIMSSQCYIKKTHFPRTYIPGISCSQANECLRNKQF